jgi:phosphoglycolate phosphatase
LDSSLSKAIIFDFDGTLVDSEKAIYMCFQSITRNLAPERINYAKNILIGPPLRETASKILGPENQCQLDKFVELFIQMHDGNVTQLTKPYPNVIEMLKKIYTKNIPMALATSKRLAPTKKLIGHFGWEDYFVFVECSDSKDQIRNKNEMIKDILKLNKDFKNSHYIGDTVNDGISANINNIKFIKASYGYGKNQDWSNVHITESIESILEIEEIFFKST